MSSGLTESGDRSFRNDHVGSKKLREIIEKRKPLACISGHVHENEGIETIGSTKILKLKPLMLGHAGLVEWNEEEKDLTIECLNIDAV